MSGNPTVSGSARASPRGPVLLGAAGVCVLAVAVGVFVLSRAPPEDRAVATIVHVLMVVVPGGVGLGVLARNRDDRFALLLVGCSPLWSLTALAESSQATAYAVGRTAVWVAETSLVFLLLAFPFGRLTTTWARRLWRLTVATLLLLYTPALLLATRFPEPSPWRSCADGCPDNALALLPSTPGIVAHGIRPLREVLVVAIFLGVAAVVVRRAADAGPLLRRAVAPVVVVAMGRALTIAAYQLVRVIDPSAGALRWLGVLYQLALPLVALSFGAGIVLRQLHAAIALQRLALELPVDASRPQLREAMARALEDPSLQIVFCRPDDPGCWLDEAGRPVTPPPPGSDIEVTEIRADGRCVAALVHDAGLGQDAVVLRAAASYAFVVLENRRLVEALRTSLDELISGRARLVAVADETRRRIERDLHDGAQQRLIGLRIKLGLESDLHTTSDVAAAARIAALGDEVEDAIDELRELAHGIYPALLSERGLPDALRAVARDAVTPTSVRIDEVGRYHADMESTVYFACLEALQNAEKHATGASHIRISLTGNSPLAFEVCDDGIGFDTSSVSSNGGGLSSLADRLGAVGGSISVTSAPGRGTCVRGSVPDRLGHA